MAGPWATPIKDHEEARETLNPMGLSFHICWFLGMIFAVLGIIAGAMDTTLGLKPLYWFLLSIATFLSGIPMLATWVLAMNLLGIGAKKEP